MAWFITALIRIATGTGVVSAITAAGIVGPLIETFDVNPVLMVLATAAGSNTITMSTMPHSGYLKRVFQSIY